jgi:uncharacterized membrane protein
MNSIDWSYIHITINHFPIVLATLGAAAALVAVIRGKRGAWLYTMATMTLAGLSVYPAYFSGDQADEYLKDPWYIKNGVIDDHNAAANYALAVLLIVGVISAYGWWRALRNREEIIPGWVRALVFAGAMLGFAVVTRTAYLGGKILHEAPVLSLKTPPAGLPPGIAATPDSAK